MIKLGFIGAGQVALRHAARLEKFPNVQVRAIVDINEDRAQSMVDQYGGAVFADYREMLESDGALDAVINCLPHNLHYESSLAIAAHGLHMLLEKPMCFRIDEADEIIAAFEKQNLRLALGYVHRYREEVLAAKRLIDAGKLGKIAMMSETLYSKGGARVPPWVWEKELSGGGVLMYTGIHAIDRLRWFAGAEPDEVYARTLTYSHEIKTEDGLVATFRFRNGVVASLVETQTSYDPLSKWDSEVFGTEGMLRMKIGQEVAFSSDKEQSCQVFERYDHFESQLRDFFEAIECGRDPWITGFDGRQSLAMVLAVYESAQTGGPVKIA